MGTYLILVTVLALFSHLYYNLDKHCLENPNTALKRFMNKTSPYVLVNVILLSAYFATFISICFLSTRSCPQNAAWLTAGTTVIFTNSLGYKINRRRKAYLLAHTENTQQIKIVSEEMRGTSAPAISSSVILDKINTINIDAFPIIIKAKNPLKALLKYFILIFTFIGFMLGLIITFSENNFSVVIFLTVAAGIFSSILVSPVMLITKFRFKKFKSLLEADFGKPLQIPEYAPNKGDVLITKDFVYNFYTQALAFKKIWPSKISLQNLQLINIRAIYTAFKKNDARFTFVYKDFSSVEGMFGGLTTEELIHFLSVLKSLGVNIVYDYNWKKYLLLETQLQNSGKLELINTTNLIKDGKIKPVAEYNTPEFTKESAKKAVVYLNGLNENSVASIFVNVYKNEDSGDLIPILDYSCVLTQEKLFLDCLTSTHHEEYNKLLDRYYAFDKSKIQLQKDNTFTIEGVNNFHFKIEDANSSDVEGFKHIMDSTISQII